MKQSSAINPGIIYIIVGAIVLVMIGGSLIIRLVGIYLALYLINHGLRVLGYPPLWIFIQQLLDELQRKFFGH